MKVQKISVISLFILALFNSAIAGEKSPASKLEVEREQAVRQYVLELGKANEKGITALFEPGGTVISTSSGKRDAKEFFHSFLPKIKSSSTDLHQEFKSGVDNSRYAARFRLTFELREGRAGDGEYMDEFLFGKNSSKLASVYMFENLKFNMKKNP